MTHAERRPRIGLLLAAGHSRRFGTDDKLLADLGGMPLVSHAASALRAAGLDRLVAVVRSPQVAVHLEGFDPVFIEGRDAPQSVSLRAGIAAAAAQDAGGVLVALGDMPRVPVGHLRALIEGGVVSGLAATAVGDRVMPPAWFGADHFAALVEVEGDRGARDLLRRTREQGRISCPPDLLTDVDLPEDLASLASQTNPKTSLK